MASKKDGSKKKVAKKSAKSAQGQRKNVDSVKGGGAKSARNKNVGAKASVGGSAKSGAKAGGKAGNVPRGTSGVEVDWSDFGDALDNALGADDIPAYGSGEDVPEAMTVAAYAKYKDFKKELMSKLLRSGIIVLSGAGLVVTAVADGSLNNTPMSQSLYAQIRGCTPQYIGKCVKRGVIVLTEDGLVVPHEATAALADAADPAREHREKKNNPGNGKPGSINDAADPESFNDAKLLEALEDLFTPEDIKLFEAALQKMPNWAGSRRVMEAIKAQNELLQYQEARGLVLDAKETELFWAEKVALVKTKLMNVPRKMAQEVSALVLKYAAQMGKHLAEMVKGIKKKKSGAWKYNSKTGALDLYTGKGKKPFATVTLDVQAPEHAESLSITEVENKLASEVAGALNELAEQKQEV